MKRFQNRRYPKEIKEMVVSAIINGEFLIEEAMAKYNLSDRRTVINWLREYLKKKEI